MSADHLSLCSSELRSGDTERVRGEIRTERICLLRYVTAAGTHVRTHPSKHTITYTVINAWACWTFVDARARLRSLFTTTPHKRNRSNESPQGLVVWAEIFRSLLYGSHTRREHFVPAQLGVYTSATRGVTSEICSGCRVMSADVLNDEVMRVGNGTAYNLWTDIRGVGSESLIKWLRLKTISEFINLFTDTIIYYSGLQWSLCTTGQGQGFVPTEFLSG